MLSFVHLSNHSMFVVNSLLHRYLRRYYLCYVDYSVYRKSKFRILVAVTAIRLPTSYASPYFTTTTFPTATFFR